VVEDDDELRNLLGLVLTRHGFEVCALADGGGATDAVDTFRPDVAVLDVLLPGTDGFSVARRLRDRSDVPVIFLTGSASEHEVQRGFAVGADDYIVKPVRKGDLVARIRAVLRRTGRVSEHVLTVADLVVDEQRHLASRAQRPLELTQTEFKLLVTMCRHPGHVFSKTQLLGAVWGYEYFAENLVEVHISALRRKLQKDGGRSLIHTVRGLGYTLHG
jgi:DNA-binding response OmpR family regulator